jgi:predicted transcriptional regulator
MCYLVGERAGCITICETAVANAISIRLDDDAVRALHELEATGISRSEAVRSALVAAADDSEIANG